MASEKVNQDLEPAPTTKKSKKKLFGNSYTPLGPLVKRLYPRAHEVHISHRDPGVVKSRLALLRAALKSFALYQTLFFALFCYLFGALYLQGKRVHELNIVFVDYDGGSIGGAIRTAYANLKSKQFPTIQEFPSDKYPTPQDLRHAVCKIDYWAALFIQPGASARLEAALAADSAQYNKTDIMQYIWNEARYPTVADSNIQAPLKALALAAQPIYASFPNWTSVIATPSENTYTTFAEPWILASDTIQTLNQGTRVVYNTLVVILM